MLSNMGFQKVRLGRFWLKIFEKSRKKAVFSWENFEKVRSLCHFLNFPPKPAISVKNEALNFARRPMREYLIGGIRCSVIKSLVNVGLLVFFQQKFCHFSCFSIKNRKKWQKWGKIAIFSNEFWLITQPLMSDMWCSVISFLQNPGTSRTFLTCKAVWSRF